MGNLCCCFYFKMGPKVEQIDSPYTELGEGPHWDAEKKSLFYVDILAGKVLRLDYDENKVGSNDVDQEFF